MAAEKFKSAAIDSSSAKLIFYYNGLSLLYIINFNEKGEMVQMETRRYMDEKRLETWFIKPTGFEEKIGIIISTRAKIFWRLKEADFSYARFHMSIIE